MDTGICTVSDEKVFLVSSDERKYIALIHKLKELHPDEVVIKSEPEDNYGMIVATVPKSWVKISPPRRVNMTDDQKEAARQRMLALHTDHSSGNRCQKTASSTSGE